MKRRVALIGTGGTISSIGRGSLDLWEYMDTSRKAEPEELLVRFPEAAEAAEIVPVHFRSVGSAAIGPGDWLALAAAVSDAMVSHTPLDGIVITHGTATLEETAYFLNLALKVDDAVRKARFDAWRGVQAREQMIKRALFGVLHDEAEVERIFLIVKAQREY